MATYLTTAQLAARSCVDLATIRRLETNGAIRCVPGRKAFRKRWAISAIEEIGAVLGTAAPQFDAVLAPIIPTTHDIKTPPKETPSMTPTTTARPLAASSAEALARFKARTHSLTLSATTAAHIHRVYCAIRPECADDMSAINATAVRIAEERGHAILPATVRQYLIAMDAIERRTGAGTGATGRPRTKTAAANGTVTPSHRRRRPDAAALSVDQLEALLPILRTLDTVRLTPAQRVYIIEWLQRA